MDTENGYSGKVNNQIKHILSDLDGVIRLYPEKRDELIEEKYDLSKGTLFKVAFKNPLLQDAVCGKISDEIWRDDILKKLKSITSESLAHSAFNEWNDFPGTVNNDYLEHIKKYFPSLSISILTNGTSRLSSDLSKIGLQHSFHRIFNSSEIGFCKPMVEAYEHVLTGLGCLPSEILFIDDSQSHIQAAKDLGFKTIHYSSYEEFCLIDLELL